MYRRKSLTSSRLSIFDRAPCCLRRAAVLTQGGYVLLCVHLRTTVRSSDRLLEELPQLQTAER